MSFTFFVHIKKNFTLNLSIYASDIHLLFSKGYHTTAIAVTWIIFLLTQHNDVYNKLKKEILEKIHGLPTEKGLFNHEIK